MKQRISVAALACALAACAAEQAVAPADNSPSNPTAVIETVVTNGGVMGMFPFEATEKLYVRSNMRRDDHSLKGTGTFSGVLTGGNAAWKAAGYPLSAEPKRMADDAVDQWRKPYERSGDTKAAMNAYLAWEIDLLPRIARDGTLKFFSHRA